MQILCTVDIRTRELYLEDVTIAAFDHLVDDVLFVIEPIDGFELETSTIKIAAVGPLEEPHDYEIDPSTVTVDEETGNINFIWSIPVGVTAMPLTTFKISDTKKITFSVCAEIVSGDNLVKAWHSDDGTIKVKAHLEPESGGGEDPEEEATNAQKIGQLQTDVAVINTQVGALANGSPTPVATVAEMTDESAVYLYMGSETGYTAGNWYFWNGSAWTSGGTYGGAVTDSTLTQEDVPADSKAVGEALALKADDTDVTALDTRVTAVDGDVSDLKEDITQKETVLNTEFGYVFPEFEYGNISSSGESNTDKVIRTGYIPFTTGQKIKVTFPSYFTLVRVLLYKQATYADSSYITLVNMTSGQTYQFNNDGLNYIRIRAVANDQVIDLTRSYDIIPQIVDTGEATIHFNSIDNELEKNSVEVLAKEQKNMTYTVSTDLVSGYVETANGDLVSNANYSRTDLIRIPAGANRIEHTFPFSSSGTDGWAVYDENKTYITGGRTPAIDVKDNYAYFAISCRISYVVDDTTAINFYLLKLNNRKYNIVMLGDSIIGNYDGVDSVPVYLGEYADANCYNCAFGGSSMGADLDHPHQYIEAFNGFKIVNAIVSGDYSEQLQAIADDPTYTELQPNFSAHISTLQNMDWSTVDVVTFSFGTNDWGTRVILSDETDDHSTDTFAGAFRTAIETLLTAYPHIKIAVCAPIWRGIVTTSGVLDDDTDTSKATRQWYLNDYREKAKEVSDEYHALYIDAYQGLNFNKYTWKVYFPLNDATHPNAIGRQAIAKKYAYCLASI